MGRAAEHSPERHPWSHPDVLPHAVASAGWGERYPAICYDERFEGCTIPHDIIKDILFQKRFAVVVWQGARVSFVDFSHMPERTFATEAVPDRDDDDWATINYYNLTTGGPMLADTKEGLDPRDFILDMFVILETPLGMKPREPISLLKPQPIQKLLIEFPNHTENRLLQLDTTVATLGGVATQEYIDTIAGRRKV